ncbi:hypothetical protein MVEN_00071600 [Mycena venus]|uniref:Uncharacterized protein n=1 Tax=Mycena venus TaxID=2733690 RepID=A0A8H6Z7D9_9AGAR|nr:hypothetical protein MVEN_00071600 [Mycena venus]
MGENDEKETEKGNLTPAESEKYKWGGNIESIEVQATHWTGIAHEDVDYVRKDTFVMRWSLPQLKRCGKLAAFLDQWRPGLTTRSTPLREPKTC